jgi:hypothetical protein
VLFDEVLVRYRSALRPSLLPIRLQREEGRLTDQRKAVASPESGDAELLRETERERLRALVGGDVARAGQLHADDFQLINPLGGSLSKEQYLAGIGSGQIRYLYWEPETIAVRLYGDTAVIRYRSQLEIVVQGRHIPRQRYWHTDLYERCEGQWRIVWSHASGAEPAGPA